MTMYYPPNWSPASNIATLMPPLIHSPHSSQKYLFKTVTVTNETPLLQPFDILLFLRLSPKSLIIFLRIDPDLLPAPFVWLSFQPYDALSRPFEHTMRVFLSQPTGSCSSLLCHHPLHLPNDLHSGKSPSASPLPQIRTYVSMYPGEWSGPQNICSLNF